MGLILKILIACHYFCIFLYHSESIVIPLWFIQRTQVLSEDDETIYSDDSFSSIYETDAKHEQFTGYSTQNSTQNNESDGETIEDNEMNKDLTEIKIKNSSINSNRKKSETVTNNIETLLEKICLKKYHFVETASKINKHISEIKQHGIENINPDLPLLNKSDTKQALQELKKDKAVNDWFLLNVDN